MVGIEGTVWDLGEVEGLLVAGLLVAGFGLKNTKTVNLWQKIRIKCEPVHLWRSIFNPAFF